MRDRQSAYITVLRLVSGAETPVEVATVPITPNSKRVFRLMGEDCIELAFSLVEAVHFAVGDWCEDELFGRFVVTEEQLPAWNPSTGGFDYTLKMEAPYMALRNKVHTLTATVGSVTKVRKETDWTLTDKLAAHAQAVIDSAELSGAGCFAETDNIVLTAERKDEVRCIAYSGVSILDAIRSIAEAFETEWWVRDGVLHFGKCEGDNTPYVFTLGRNVERMDVQDDLQEYCNSMFAFGGTENVPSTYRRSLVFEVTESKSVPSPTRTGADLTGFMDGGRKVTPGMIYGGYKEESYSGESGYMQGDYFVADCHQTFLVPGGGKSTFSGSLLFYCKLNGSGTGSLELSFVAIPLQTGLTSITVAGETVAVDVAPGSSGSVTHRLFPSGTFDIRPGAYKLSLTAKVVNDAGGTLSIDDTLSEIGDVVTVRTDATSCDCKLEFGGGVYEVTFNPSLEEVGDADYYFFAFKDGEVPQGFGVGSEYSLRLHDVRYNGVLETGGLEVTETPVSWWRRDYDNPSSLLSIGENRLMLPLGASPVAGFDIGDGRISLAGLTPGQTVERSVVFGEVYPQCVLVVDSVSERERKTHEEYEDGSRTAWQWREFTVACSTVGGSAFPFRGRYVKDGATLRMRFISDTDLQRAWVKAGLDEAGYKAAHGIAGTDWKRLRLAGMSFDVRFDGSSQEYTLVRNDEYGAMLPNETLCPSVGDAFVLEGWDVRAMSSLGLVEDAEATLLEKALEYLGAMDEGQFVFTCDMMSEWMFRTEDGWADLQSQDGGGGVEDFLDSEERQVRVWHEMPIPFMAVDGSAHEPVFTGGRQFFVRNGFYWFLLPLEGTRVTVVHAGLKKGSKTSRIIGYEFKLDKPYDTPRYTIGETEAYSRLRQLEKTLGITKK